DRGLGEEERASCEVPVQDPPPGHEATCRRKCRCLGGSHNAMAGLAGSAGEAPSRCSCCRFAAEAGAAWRGGRARRLPGGLPRSLAGGPGARKLRFGAGAVHGQRDGLPQQPKRGQG
ncbi:unnamed protein product, partial [Symbiodinium sp. CCMP2456]